ncbi:hypothetical protein NQ317_017751 [Molorchus minor]|uniref:Sialin n=1 Tax=Molorchus minor TaxID=1323400 RepID=A0ABQ9JVH8_9CUCU|nr:hypothetical protein NQ317_017751 [Molorchus minor]
MEKAKKLKLSDCLVTEVKECCSARDVLWYLVFIGFAVNYMIRINLNIAIVSMVKLRPKNNVSLSSECLIENFNNATNRIVDNLEQSKSSFMISNESLISTSTRNNSSNSTTNPGIAPDRLFKFESRKFDWNEKEQGSILGSFFWVHWATQIPGGLLASRYGTKLVFGLSNFTGALCTFAMPFLANMGSAYLIAIRVFQGLLLGFTWPAMHNMTARWIPPNERSNCQFSGSSVGAALTYPVYGFIIDRWGWELVFYVSGVIGTLWYIAWCFMVYACPAQHRRYRVMRGTTSSEVLGRASPKPGSFNMGKFTGKLLTDSTVWMNILAQFRGVWGLFTLMTHAPTCFKFIHGWNIRATGLLSGMPHLFRMLWAYIFSQLGDYLLRSGKMTRSNVRKLATAVSLRSCQRGTYSCIVQGIFMLGLAYSGCNHMAAIVLLTLAVASHGAVSTGPLASVVDISPNYASVVLGTINTIVAMVGFLTPVLVGHLTFQNQTVTQWQKVFWIATAFLFFSGIMYSLFAKSELKSWNSPGQRKDQPESEMMVIKGQHASKGTKANNDYKQVPVVYTREEK